MTPDPTTIGYSFPFNVRCRGNFSSTFDIDLVFSPPYEGYLGRGTVFPPASQNATLGFNQTSSNVIAVNLGECPSRPLVAPVSDGFTVGQVISTITVGGTGCTNPMTVTLPAGYSGPATRAFTFSPLFTIASCAASTSYTYSYHWNVTGTSRTSTKANLAIKARSLPPGTYQVNLAVTVSGLGVFMASSQLVITPLPPVVVVSPSATRVEIGVDEDFVLDGSASYDPNTVTGQPAVSVSCLWSCLYLDGSEPCVVPNPALCVLTMPNATLVPNENLQFELVVTSSFSGLTTTWTILVDTFPSVIATISLGVVGMSPDGYVDGTQPIRILGSVVPSNSYYDVSYQWNSVALATTQSLKLWNGTLLSGNTSYNLVIAPNTITPGLPYLCRLTVSLPSFNPVQADIQFNIYPPPTGGFLDVEPTTGSFEETIFALNAYQWIDPTASSTSYLLYNFAVAQPGLPLYFLKQRADDNAYLATQNLPVGNYTLYAYVYSAHGFTVSNGVEISVQANSAITIDDLAQNLEQSASRQDQNAIVQLVSLLVGMANSPAGKKRSLDASQLTAVRAQLVAAIQMTSNLTNLTTDDVSQLVPHLNVSIVVVSPFSFHQIP